MIHTHYWNVLKASSTLCTKHCNFPQASTRALTLALKAVETLMEMSAGSAEEAHVRLEQIGDGWIASN